MKEEKEKRKEKENSPILNSRSPSRKIWIFSPPFPSVNEFANLDNLSIDRGKKKKKRKSWRVASPDTISLFSFDVAPLYTRRIKIEIDRCDRRCLNSLKKIRVTRHVEIENLNLYGFERGERGREGGEARNPGSQLVIIVWKCRIKAVVAQLWKG